MSSLSARDLTSGRLLARNTVLNLLGLTLPLLAGLVAIPLLLSALGTDRFALLTLAWVVIGHATLFDLGLGRALTHAVSERLGAGKPEAVPGLVWTASLAVLAVGVGAAAAGLAVAPWLAREALEVPPGLVADAAAGFRFLALAIPFVVLAAILRGLLEAIQRFDLLSALRVPTGALMFVAPLLVLPFERSFSAAVLALVAARALSLVAHVVAVAWALPSLRRPAGVDLRALGALSRFGGWMTAALSVGAAIDYASRFLIGAVLPVAAVAYFATPADIITKVLVVPGALVGVLFPALTAHAAQDPARAAALLDHATRLVLALLFPVVLVLVALGPEALALWLGPAFAAEAAGALRWLAVAALLNGLAFLPAAGLGAVGRPDLAGIPPLVEFPFFLAATWAVLAHGHGVEGVAAVYAARVAVDTAVMFFLVQRVLVGAGRMVRRIGPAVLAVLALLAVVTFPESALVRGALALGGGALALAAGWRWVLDARERALLWARIRAPFTAPE